VYYTRLEWTGLDWTALMVLEYGAHPIFHATSQGQESRNIL
jgi:hypothetical protein